MFRKARVTLFEWNAKERMFLGMRIVRKSQEIKRSLWDSLLPLKHAFFYTPVIVVCVCIFRKCKPKKIHVFSHSFNGKKPKIHVFVQTETWTLGSWISHACAIEMPFSMNILKWVLIAFPISIPMNIDDIEISSNCAHTPHMFGLIWWSNTRCSCLTSFKMLLSALLDTIKCTVCDLISHANHGNYDTVFATQF